MDSVQDALNVLGLGLEASADEIHQAYRDLCMVWHPDRFPNESRVRQKAEEKLKQINGAHRVLQEHNRTSSTRTADKCSQSGGSQTANCRTNADSSQKRETEQGHHEPEDSTRSGNSRHWAPKPRWSYLYAVVPITAICLYLWDAYAWNRPDPKESPRSDAVALASTPEVRDSESAWVDKIWPPSNKSIQVSVAASTERNNNESTVPNRARGFGVPAAIAENGNQSKSRPEPESPSQQLTQTEKPHTSGSNQSKEVDKWWETDPIASSGRIIWDDAVASKDQSQSVQETNSTPATYTIGSPKDEVLRLQGTPTAISSYPALGHELWTYGSSTVEVSTKTGLVSEWDNSGNLKVFMQPGKNITTANVFTRGSHKDDVLRLHGTPTAISNYQVLGREVWTYGFSSVVISTETGCVTEWKNSGNLRVELKPSGN